MAVVDASSDDNFDDVANQTVTATTTDDDSASFTLGAISGTVSEGATTATFTVVLGAQPDSDVVISVTSGDTGEATVSAENLTFTNGNWNTPQTVTVTGVDDNLVDGSVNTTITMAVVDNDSDDNFDALADQTVTVTTTDNDTAGFTLSATTATVTEAAGGGNTATYTVVLDAQPDSDVVISVTSGDTGEVTVSAATLTFTNANWSNAQTVTLTGVDDNLIDVDTQTTVTMAVVDNDSDDNFDGVANQTVTVTTTDNDTAAFTLGAISGTVTEAGSTATFTVVLGAQPDSDVVISVTSGDTGEATVSPATLTFTNGNWNSTQTVTVTGVDDNIIDGNINTTITMAVVDNDSDDNFDALADQTVTATTVDDDTAAFTLGAISGTVTEAGSTATFTVVLGAQPDSNVVISVTSGDTGEATVSPATLTFTNGNWNSTQTVTVTGVDDNIIDGNINTTITMAVVDNDSDDNFDALADQTVTATTVDDDTAGFTLSTTTATVAETGTTATFTVVLDAEPSSNVVISVTSGDTGEATVSAENLTFTTANWDSAQTVTVTGVDDTLADGSQSTTITMAVVDNDSDDNFDALADQTVTVTTTDNDTAGFTLSKTDAIVTNSGGTDTFTVVLDVQPVGNVVIDVASSNTDEVTVSATSLTFTTGNWDTPQTITVTGVNGATVSDSTTTTITMSVNDGSSEDNYDAVANQTVSTTFTIISAVTQISTPTNDATPSYVFTTNKTGTVTTNIAQGILSGGTVTSTGNNTVTFNTLPDGTYAGKTITFTDAANNAQSLTLTTFVVDTTAPTNQNTVFDTSSSAAAGDTITIVSSGDSTNQVWFAPAGTTSFSTGATMTQAASGTATSIAAPANEGTYYIYVIDQAGNVSSASTAALTVDNSAPSAFTTGSVTSVGGTVIANYWNSTNSSIKVTIPVANDSSLTGGTIQLEANVAGGGFETFGSAYTITGDDLGTSYEFSQTATVFEALSGGLSDSESVTFRAIITDLAGNSTTGTASGTTIAIDQTAPTVFYVTSSSSDGLYSTGDVLSILVFTSDNVTVTGTPQLTLETGGSDEVVDYSSGSGSSVLVFSYTVASGNNSSDLDYASTGALALNGGSINDSSGNPLTLTLATPGAANSLGANKDLVVDTAAPTNQDDVFPSAAFETVGGSVTIVSSGIASNQIWIAPAGTASFSASATMTQATSGTATSMTAPTTAGTYYIYVIDAAGNVSSASTAALTVGNAGFTLGAISGTVTEAGTTATFTAVLDSRPDSDVVISVTSGDTGEVTVSAATLTFTEANWNNAQTVTVTGVDDNIIDGNINTTITMAVVDNDSDDNFDALADQTVTATTVDNDTAAFTLGAISGTVTEAGSTATFTVVLGAQPDSDVVISVTSGDTGEATVSPATLTFTNGNWNSSQTVTVTGVDDNIIDGNINTTITMAVVDNDSDDNFDALADQTVTATTVDDDTAGFTLSTTTATVAETGTTATFTVVLDAEPSSNVVISVTSGDTGEATVSAANLTFTTANWDSAQTVTVTGVDDNLVDGSVNTTITMAVVDASSDDNFDDVANQTVTATTTDDDTAGFTLSATTATVTEAAGGGNTATYTVVLDAQPDSDVVISVTSGDTGEVTVSAATLTFTNGNWDTPQTVTLTGVDDNLIDVDTQTTVTMAVVDNDSDDNFDGVANQTVTVTTTDNDTAAFTLGAISGTVTEAGSTATFTVVLGAQPDSDVVISVTSGDTGEATVSPATLTFTNGNWNSTQTVTVTGVDDNIIDGNINTTITMAVVDNDSDDNFDALADQTVTATTVDDDTAAFTLGAISGTVTEAGSTATFTVVLGAQPDSDVVISVTSGDTGEATVSPATLTFTNGNWNSTQTVTVTGVDDNIIDGNINTTITMAVVDNDSDDNFDALADQTVTATTVDDDTAGFTLSTTTATVAETGTTATFTVVLDAEPSSNVVISVTSGDTGEATVSAANLTFTTANWDSAQTVTVTGVDDNIIDGNINTTITMAVVDASSDDNFDDVANQTVTATTTDDDSASFTLGAISGTVSEGATTATFTVVLGAQPDSDVVISVTSGDTGEATVSAENLTFTNGNWNTPQTVTVTGVDDNLVDGSVNTTITMAVVDNDSDDNFDALADQTVTVTTTDNDTAGFTLSATTATVTEAAGGGNTATYTVVLDAQPDSDVVISVTSGDTGEVTVSAATLTFTNANWSNAQTVTLTGVDDNLIDVDTQTTVTMAVVDNDSDDNFDGVANQTVTVTTTDNDTAAFTLGAISGTVTEAGSTATFTVVLGAQPDSDVVISVTSGDTGEATVSPATLTFTNGNWNSTQTVTVTGVDDNIIDGNINTTITMAVVDNDSDDNFDALADQTVTATTVDDDTAGFTLSTTTATVAETGTTATFTVVLDAQPSSNVVISVTSGDTGEATVSAANLTFTNGNWDSAQTVTVTGVDDNIIDGNINTTITMAVVDASSDDNFDDVANQTVTATTTDDDSASFTLGAISGTVSEGATTATFTVVLGAQPDSDVVISVTSGDTGEATVSAENLTFTNGNWNTPQTVTVTGVDDNLVDGSVNTTITMAVVDNDSDDNFDALADQTVTVTTTDNDTAGFTLSATTATVTEAAGGGNTATYTVVLDAQPDSDVVISVTSGDTGEVTVSAATLTFTNANWSNAQTVTLTGVDDNLIDVDTQTTVTMAVVDNDSDDNFDGVANQTVTVTTTDNDTAAFTLGAISGTVTEAGSTATFTVVLGAQPDSDVVISVTSGDTGEATVSPATLTFTNGNWNSTQTVTVTGVDDNIIDGNINTTITMAVVDNDSDYNFDALADQTVTATTVDDDTAGFTLSTTTATVAETGTTATFTVVLDAEPSSNVVISVTSGDTGEATVSAANLTFTTANWDSAQTVTVTGVDDNIIDGNINTTITMAVVDASSDDNFDDVANQTVTATTTDDDSASFTLGAISGTVSEGATTATFTVVLGAQPDSDVVISVTSGDTGEATVSAENLTFTNGNWNTPQTVTVTGVDDNLVDGSVNTTITMAVVDNDSDDNFDALADQTVTVTTTDNDTAGFTLSATTATVTEAAGGGNTATYTVVLDAQPDSDVVISVTSGDTGEVTVSAATLTFTNANWSNAQTVTLTGVDDNLIDVDTQTTVTMAVVDNDSDDNFDGVANQTVTVTTTDNDTAAFTLGAISGTVTEAGSTATFTVVLGAQPDSDVVISVTSGDTGEATVSPATLTFTNGNWNSTQTVTVTGVDDNIIDGNINTTITMAVVDNDSDDNFDALADQTVTATTVDDDTAGFTLSTTTATVAETGTTATFTVVLDAEPSSNVVISVTSGDTGEATVSAANLTFTTANWDSAQTVTVTGVDDNIIDGNINTTITMAVVDASSDDNFDDVANQTVTATTTDDDSASFTLGAISGTVSEGATTATFTVVLGAQPDSDVVISVTSGDTGEATVSAENLTFTNGNWNTPQTVTVTGVDDNLVDGSVNTTITMAVVDESSDNNFDALADQTVTVTTTDNDTAGFTLSATTATVTEAAGGGNTATYTVVLDAQPDSDVVISVTSGDTGEVTVSAATLTFTNANWSNAQTVTLTGVDDNLIDVDTQTTVTMAVVDNDSDDNFDGVANQTVTVTTTDNDTAAFTLGAISGTVTEAGSTATFTVVLGAQPDSDVVISVTSGDTGEATVSPATLTFTNGNWNSTQTVTVTGVDDNIIDGNINTTITMAVVDNDSDDNFDALADQTVTATTVDDDTAAFTLGAISGTVTEAGSTATFTVVLGAQPDSDVVISVTSGDTGEATVSPATLTFTNGNWNSTQTVTVTGVDDNIIDGNINTTITMAVVDNDSDDNFDALADQTVTATTVDDDTAGFTLSTTTATVAETGTTATFTVVLDAEPSSNVVISVTSGDTGEATVSAANLTFTTANWDSAQTVTVTGVDDNIIDGNINTTITMAVVDASSDDNFDDVANQTVTATTTDDDSASFTLGAISGTVSEGATTATFTVVLGAQPDSDVVISVTSGDTGEATVSAENLTFTNGNWNTPQTVTVTGVDDNLVDGSVNTTITMAVVDNDSDDNFDALADQTVTVTTTDNDTAGFTLSATTATVTEAAGGGNTATYTVVLDAQPDSDVVISVTSGDTGEVTVSAATLTFTNANWSNAQTVTLTGVDDNLIDVDTQTTVTMAVVDNDSDDNFDGVANQTVTVTTTDNDTAAFTLGAISGTVTEAGSTATFTVVLGAQPDSDVVISVTSGDTGEATVSPATLTFTNGNWNSTQTVTVTGVDDNIIDGNINTTITMAVVDNDSDDNFDALADQTVTATTVDDDTAGFTLSTTTATVAETGTTATFTVVLDAQPDSDVVISVTSGDTGEATVSAATLTFTNGNWDSAQTVTVTGVDDNSVDGNQNTTITMAVVDASSDDNFDDVANQTVTATTTDDDTALTSVNSTKTNGSYTIGEVIPINIIFNSQVTVTGTPQLTLETGDSDAVVNYSSGSGGFSLVFNYTVASGNNSSDLDYASTGALALNGGSINDADGNPANLTLPTPGAANSLGANKALVIDTSAPSAFTAGSVTSVGGTVVANYWNSLNTSITVTIPVANDATLTGGTIQLQANVAGGGFEAFGSAYTIQGSDLGTNYDFNQNATEFEALSGGLSDSESVTFRAIITDLAGNTTTGTASGTTIVIDQTAPTNQDDVFPSATSETVGGTVTIVSSGIASNQVWIAPAGTTSFSSSATMTQATSGTATSMTVPTTAGTYYIYVIDAAGNYSSASTAALTVGNAGFTLGAISGTVAETGTTATFTVVLDSRPDSDVVISVTSGDTGEATVSPATLTFTEANWNSAQTVTVTGVDDNIIDGNINTTITMAVVDNDSDDNFDALADQTVTATTTDDDTAGFTLGAISGTVAETGTTATFTVVLDAQPDSDVVISVTSGDTGEATVSAANLTFTNGNWDSAQTVTVTGVDDNIIDGNINTTITMAVVDASSDDNFDDVANQTVTATTTDDDSASFTLGAISGTVSEGATTATFTVVLGAQPDSDVVISVTSGDTGEATVSAENLTFTNGNWNTPQTVTVTGVDDNLIDGSVNTTITMAVVDASSDNNFDALADQTVTVTTTDNDTAAFTLGAISGTVTEAGKYSNFHSSVRCTARQ